MKSVTIRYGASTSYLVAPEKEYPGLLSASRRLLASWVDGAEFVPAYRNRSWDGYHRPVSTGGAFPTGLLPEIIRICSDHGYTPLVENSCEELPIPKKPPHLIGRPDLEKSSPYWYQWESVKAILKNGRGVVKVPTGGGKTNIAALVMKALPKKRFLFLVDSIDLLQQTATEFSSLLGEEIGCIGGGRTLDPSTRICVSSVQSLIEKKDRKTKAIVKPLWSRRSGTPEKLWLDKVDILFADECHLATSSAFFDVIQALKNTPYRFGLSATPFRRGDYNTLLLREACGGAIVDIPASELISRGILAEPRIYMVAYDGYDIPEGSKNKWMEYRDAVKTDIYNNIERNIAVCQIAANKEKVLILVENKKIHGPLLYDMLVESNPGREVVYLNGSMVPKVRKRGREAFKNGEVDILIATPIFNKGVDLPNIRTLILAGGGKSPVNVIQRLGRGMRGSKEKKIVEVYDFMDLRNGYVSEHTAERITTYEGEGYQLTVFVPEAIDSKER